MSQKTNLNISPYYDDFDKYNNFYKVLFKPGHPVQARELTTLQSMLQNQVTSFGSHIFKEGSMVIPGNIVYDSFYPFVKLNPDHLGIDVSVYGKELVGKRLRGQDSGVVVVVDKYYDVNPTIGITDPTIFVKYIRSGTDNQTNPLRDGEVLITETAFTYGNTSISAEDSIGTIISENGTGAGSAAAIGSGVYFIRGTFVDVEAGKIVLDPYTNTPSYRVGLTISEEIITAKDDNSLYDNAKGFSNYAAPGADRLKITTTLSTKLLTDNDDKTFVELLRVENGEIKKLQDKSQYSIIKDYFAKRTFEESGDYTVGHYDVDIKESLNDRQSNGGIYFEGQETLQGNTPSEDLMGVSVSAGKAYVRGYDIESKANKVVDVEKPRDKEKIDSGNVPFEMGTLVRLNNVVGTPIIDNNVSDNTVKLYNERRTASNDATGGTHIGNARVYTFNLTDGSYENAGSKWDLYLYDIQTFTAITLNQNITLTQTERVRGVSSGATGYISNAGSNTATAFNLIGTSGTFVAGESVIINENPDTTRVLNSFIAYSADDIRSVLQDTPSKNNAYKTHFIGDTVLEPKVIPGFSITDQLVISPAGITTATGRNWASKVKVGDIIRYQTTSLADPTFNRVSAVATDGKTITLAGITDVTGVADGTLVTSTFQSFRLMTPTVRKKGGLYAKLDNSDIASVDLANSQLFVTRQLTEQTSTGSAGAAALSIQTSSLAGVTSSFFQPYDAERYSVHFANDTTEALTSDQVNLVNNGAQVNITGLSAAGSSNVTVNTTLRKQGIVSKVKEYVRSQKVEVNTCVSAATTALSGLTTSVYYGLRVDDQEISLNYPDVANVVAVYESLDSNAITLDTIDFPSGLNLDTATIVGESILGSESGVLAQVTNRTSSTRIEVAYLNSNKFVLGELVTFQESNIKATVQAINKGNYQNVTNHFDLDKGHRDTILDYSRLVRKNDGYKPTNRLLAIFDYYSVPADDTGDVFTVNSYPDEKFSQGIPKLPDGTRASDTLDFRPRVSTWTSSTASPFAWQSRDVGGVTGNPSLVVTPGEASSLGYEFYLPRIDRLVLDIRGKFSVIKGSSSINPTFPVNEEQAMDIARIELPAYLYNVDDAKVIMVDNRRYTMRDIGKLEDRIENLETVTSLSLLELSTKTLQVKDADGLDRFKSGFFVDDYKDDKRLDVPSSKMSINNATNELTSPIDFDFIGPEIALNPSIDTSTVDYSENHELLDSNVQKTGELVTLKYSEKEFLSQPLASRVENVNPFNMISFTGRITLTPNSDNWVRNVYVDGGERRVTGDRNDEFIDTIKIGSGVDKYIRSRNVKFSVSGLQPYTRYYPFFDSVSGIDFIPKLVEISMSSGSFSTGETVKGYVGGTHLFTARLCQPNHKTGNPTSPKKTFGKNPYDRSITLSTAYSASSTTLNIDIASLSKEAQGKYNGYIVKDMVILGETSGAEAKVSDVRLINDNWGDLEGSFFFRDPNTNPAPPLRWTTGQKTFKLTSSSTNAKSLPGSLLISRGETSYWTSGIVDTYRQTRVIVRMPPPPPPNQNGDGDSCDPLAQSFTTEREGMFLTAVDLFFGNKDENEKVTVELRTVELGTPTNELVQDFARVVLDPNEVNTSTDGKTATKVTFPSPIYLTPQTEYAIVILAPTTNLYEAWIARMGEKTVGTSNLPDDENVIVTKQYVGGSLFKSQNGTIWTPNQFEDLKFKIYRADFVNSGTLTFYNPSIEDGDVGHLGMIGDAIKTLPRKLKVGFDNITGVPGSSGVAQPLVIGAKVADGASDTDAYGYIEAVGGSANDLVISNAGSGYQNQSGTANVSLYPITSQERTAGSATVTITNGVVSTIAINGSARGAGYKIGDVVGIATADLTGARGSGAQITISTLSNYNTFFLTNVSGEQFPSSGSVDIYVNDTQFNSGSTHFVSSSQNGTLYSGNTLEVNQFSHGMHGAANIVQLSGIEPNSIPTTITGDVDINSTGTISVANTSIFARYEGLQAAAAADETGYVKINNEIIYYSGITASGGGAGTIGISTRGIDGSVSRKHINGTQIQPYTLNGVSLRRINKTHSSTSVMDSPKDLDKYYLQFDRTSEDTKRDTGDSMLNFTNENSLGGPNLYSTKNIQFNTIHPRINVITPGEGTTITGQIRTISGTSAGGVESSFMDQGFQSVEINDTTRLSSPRIIASKVNETAKLGAMTMNKSFTMTMNLTSNSSHVSPVVDLDNAIVILGRNRLNKPVNDYASNGASNSVSEDPHTGVYVTKRVDLKNPSSSLKVVVGAYRHTSADFRVLYQLFRNDSEDVEQSYVPFPGYDNLRDTDGDGFGDRIIDATKNNGRPDARVAANAENEFSEYQFSTEDLEPFTGFRIKIVMSGTNEAFAPRFKDFRVIALA